MGGVKSGKSRNKTQGRNSFISWFEIPVNNFEQAVDFYQTIFNIKMETNINDTNAMAFFPPTLGVGGSIVAGPGYVPANSGVLVYLNGGNDLSKVLDKVKDAGGRVIMQKTLIAEDVGYFAIFLDSQGNKLALFSHN